MRLHEITTAGATPTASARRDRSVQEERGNRDEGEDGGERGT
jgi:hypothetical protein